MVISKSKSKTANTPSRLRFAWVVTQFLTIWLTAIFVLTTIAFLLDLDWAKPEIQQMLSTTLNRKVKLGQLSWNFGLNGLAIATNHLSIRELDGQPFLVAGQSEIGIAFLPLWHKQIRIHHFKLEKPEVWAVRLASTPTKDRWNFSDLLENGQEIQLTELSKGQLHIIDRTAKSPWNNYNLSSVGLKFRWPHEHKRWPFMLTFCLNKPTYTSKVTLSGLGVGTLDNWQKNYYRFDLHVDNAHAQDFAVVFNNLNPLGGTIDLHLTGNGIFAKGIKVDLTSQGKDLSWTANAENIKSPKISTSANFLLKPDNISWNNLAFEGSGIKISSIGGLVCKPFSHYTSSFSIDNANTQFMVNICDREKFASLLAHIAALDLENNLGNATNRTQQNIGKLINNLTSYLKQQPLSKISGTFQITPHKQFEASAFELAINNSVIKLSGIWNQQTNSGNLSFSGNKIDVKDVLAPLLHFKNIAALNSLRLAGSADISGKIAIQENQHKTNISINLQHVDLKLPSQDIGADKLTGLVQFDGTSLIFNKVAGTTSDGNFVLNGSINLSSHPICNLQFKGTHFDLAQLSNALKTLKVQLPVLTEKQLYGRVEEITLDIKGPPESPQISLTAVPENLYYKPNGLAKALRATSGDIYYDHDQLKLKEVGLVGQNSKIFTSCTIDNLSGAAILKNLSAKTASADMSDVHFYLSSPLMPEALHQGYLDFLKRNNVLSFHGKVWGDVVWRQKDNKGNDFTFDGLVGFFDVGGRFGTNNYPLEHAAGIITAAGPKLLLQNISGSVGGTHFALDGHINNYRSNDFKSKIDLKAEVYPDELLQLLPGLADTLKGHVISSGPLSLKANVRSNKNSNHVVFTAYADPLDNLRLITSTGTLYQPLNQAITLDGTMTIKSGPEGSISIQDSQLLIGNSSLQAHGSYTWFGPGIKQFPFVDLQIQSTNPIDAKILIAILDPTSASGDVKGTVTPNLMATGSIDQLITTGRIDFNDITLPQYNLYKLTGRVETPRLYLPISSPLSPTQPNTNSESRALLHLDTIASSNLTATNVDAKVVLLPPTNALASHKIALQDGIATVAGGTINLNGWLDLADHQIYMLSKINKVSANDIASKLFGHPGELTGTLSGNIELQSQGLNYTQLMQNMDGNCFVTIANGNVARFGQLQTRLTQANFFQQGIFGFNLNNLLQSVVPVRSGDFKELHGKFSIANGTMSIEELRFNGDDMCLWAGGAANLPLDTLTIEVAGKLPRVSSSLIFGPVGQVSKRMTLQNLIRILTLHKLESLPSFPVLGDIGSDRPRTFLFRITAPLDKPRLITQSIEKTFHWLPERPNASAHPVPGI